MKIGILTFCRSANYGSFLQCHSLYSKLQKINNTKIVVINYSTISAEAGFIVMSLLRGPLKGFRQYQLFKKLASKVFNLDTKLISNSAQKTLDYVNSLSCDIIVAGSDEIWKINKFRKYPNIYWQCTGLNAKKISYAASANRTYFDKLSDNEKSSIKKELEKYSYLGVRDQGTYDLLKSFGLKKTINMNCDPTFFYNFPKTPRLESKLQKKYGINIKKPIIGLITNNKLVGKSIKKKFGETHQLVSITTGNKYSDFWLYDLSPFEWANMFRYFDGCVTSYFHGTLFSIFNHIPFVSFDYENYSLMNTTKIQDILNKAEMLKNNYFNILQESPDNIAVQLQNNIKENDTDKYDRLIKGEKKKWELFEHDFNKLIENIAYEQQR